MAGYAVRFGLVKRGMPIADRTENEVASRGQRRRRLLIDTARVLFFERGYRGTSLQDIIDRAGGSREMIYTAFGGKHGLLGAIVAETGAAFAAYIIDPAAMMLPARQGLERLGIELMRIWRSPEGRAVHRMVASEGSERPEILHAWYRGATAPYVAALSHYLRQRAEAGEIAVADPELAARQFLALLAGERAQSFFTSTEVEPDDGIVVARSVELILCAYGTAHPHPL